MDVETVDSADDTVDFGQLRESQRVAAQGLARPQAGLTGKGSFGSRKEPKLKLARVASVDNRVITSDSELTIEQMFQVLDADASGGLDMLELKGFVKLLGIQMSEEQVQGMLQSKLKKKLLDGEEPELDFEGFKEFVDPILDEARKAAKKAAEDDAREAEAKGRINLGAFEPSALGFLTLENPARLATIKLVSQPAFDYVVLGLIGCNSVLMALEDPLRPETDNPEWIADAELAFVRTIITRPAPRRSSATQACCATQPC